MKINNQDVVESNAYKFIQKALVSSDSTEKLVSDLESQRYRYRREKDKLKYLTVVSQYVQEESEKHSKECKNPSNCSQSKALGEATFFLNQMLEEYGIGINNDEVFTNEERYENNKKLDDMLQEIETLKMGQEIIYDDLKKEIEELKNLYFIGKKNWYQNLAGKSLEMVASGVVNETISKKLISIAGVMFNNLIQD
ncbi:MAG: hypothetical protein LBM67_04705 [Lentimicrobiaceae bacterium]|jgi:hypothetical protein|nr:hypothetical protein [Lentimicrobiaceae bacterium]